MKIQILGTGCPKCRLLKKGAQEAVERLGVDAEIEEVQDIDTMMEMGMLMSPGFAVDHTLIQSGKVLTTEQIESILNQYSEEWHGEHHRTS